MAASSPAVSLVFASLAASSVGADSWSPAAVAAARRSARGLLARGSVVVAPALLDWVAVCPAVRLPLAVACVFAGGAPVPGFPAALLPAALSLVAAGFGE